MSLLQLKIIQILRSRLHAQLLRQQHIPGIAVADIYNRPLFSEALNIFQ